MPVFFSKSNSLSPMDNIRNAYYGGENGTKGSFFKQLFRGRSTDPVESIGKLLETHTVTAKDALVCKAVIGRRIKKENDVQTLLHLKKLDGELDSHLLMSSLDMSSPKEYLDITEEMRLQRKSNYSSYQEQVKGLINRDIGRSGYITVNDEIFETQLETISTIKNQLISELKKYHKDTDQSVLERYVERAMLMATQDVANGLYMKYRLTLNGVQSLDELSKKNEAISLCGDLPMITKFSVNKEGIVARAQKVYELELHETGRGPHISKTPIERETIITATATMPFEKHFENCTLTADEKEKEPLSIEVGAVVNVDTHNIHAYTERKQLKQEASSGTRINSTSSDESGYVGSPPGSPTFFESATEFPAPSLEGKVQVMVDGELIYMAKEDFQQMLLDDEVISRPDSIPTPPPTIEQESSDDDGFDEWSADIDEQPEPAPNVVNESVTETDDGELLSIAEVKPEPEINERYDEKLAEAREVGASQQLDEVDEYQQSIQEKIAETENKIELLSKQLPIFRTEHSEQVALYDNENEQIRTMEKIYWAKHDQAVRRKEELQKHLNEIDQAITALDSDDPEHTSLVSERNVYADELQQHEHTINKFRTSDHPHIQGLNADMEKALERIGESEADIKNMDRELSKLRKALDNLKDS